ncbi:hypothetical protein SAMN04487950_1541 [Halogranum rubrum]|uniref:Uncharacterized protein n=1 Tax=Halogranum rubrum TaxID=553466 RepID=A0A1I4D2T5_9EURY|nr:hypothetical protein [Halogranum rubrum]SFK87049.1 hypothetical protein SAMN04487950_1541 [Halogranum rubrum]
MSSSDETVDEEERIRQFLSQPRSRRHPDMLLPDQNQPEQGDVDDE